MKWYEREGGSGFGCGYKNWSGSGKGTGGLKSHGFGYTDGSGLGCGAGYGDEHRPGCGYGYGYDAGDGTGRWRVNGDICDTGEGSFMYELGWRTEEVLEIGCIGHSIDQWLGEAGRQALKAHPEVEPAVPFIKAILGDKK